jgi:hypothetical protein
MDCQRALAAMTSSNPPNRARAIAERIILLASPDSIRSQNEAFRYVEAVCDAWGLSEPWLRPLQGRVAQAELVSIQDPQARVSVENIANIFNELMREVGAPKGMRINGAEVERFRRNFLRVAKGSYFPSMVARLDDGSVDMRCRPVESVYLIFLLQYGPNIEASKNEVTSTLGDKFTSHAMPRLRSASAREMKYSAARESYFRRHSDRAIATTLGRLLDNLFES